MTHIYFYLYIFLGISNYYLLEYSGPTGLTILAPAGSFWASPNLYTKETTCPCFEQTK